MTRRPSSKSEETDPAATPGAAGASAKENGRFRPLRLLLISPARPCRWQALLGSLECLQGVQLQQLADVGSAVASEEVCFSDVVLLAADSFAPEARVQVCRQLLQVLQGRALYAPVLALGLEPEDAAVGELVRAGLWEALAAEVSAAALEQALNRALLHAQSQERSMRLAASLEGMHRNVLQFFAEAPLGMALFDSRGVLRASNKSAGRILGLGAKSFVGRYNHFHDPEARRTGSSEALERALGGEVVFRDRVRMHVGNTTMARNGQGRTLWARSRFFPVSLPGATEPMAGCLFEDIEEEVLAGQEKSLQQQRLRLAQRIAGLGYWELRYHSGQVYWSEECCSLLGLEQEGGVHCLSQLRELLHPDDVEPFSRKLADLAVFSMPLDLELRIIRGDGEERVLRCLGESTWQDAEPVLHGAFLDITEARRDAARLQEAHALLQTILDTMPSPMFFKDSQGRYAIVNNAFAELHGLTKHEILGRTVRDLAGEGLSETYEEMDKVLLQSRGPCVQRFEYPVQYADGALGAMLFNKGPVFDAQGRNIGLVCIMNDITERIRNMAELRLRCAFEGLLSSLSASFLDMGTERIDKGVEEALERLGDFFRGERAVVLTWDRQAGTMHCNHQWRDLHAPSVCESVQEIGESGLQWLIDQMQSGRELLVQDIEELQADAVCRETLRSQGVCAFLAAPLLLEGQVRGCIRVDRLRQHTPWKPEMPGWLRQVADIVSNALNRARKEEQLRRATETAERSTLAKSDLLATMSHELRTPMNGILGLARLLLETEPDDDRREDLQTLKETAQSLLFLLNDILDFSKIEAGKMQLEIRPCHLRELLESAVKVFAAQAAKDGLTLQLEMADTLPAKVRTDPDRLRQILNNLLSNALKFTLRGGVSIQASPLEGREGMLRFVVQDTGMGIDAEQQKCIFERFSQADGHASRRLQGTGLGLAICKRLCTMLGGEISVQSQPGVGSAFTFSIEAPEVREAKPDDADAAPREVQEQLPDAPLRVLVAEDNDVNRKVVCSILESRGHYTAWAGNGRETLEKLDQEPFDLLLLDIMMPVMDGLECAARIRQGSFRHNPPDLPIIACTAHAMHGDKEQFMRAGMNGYVAKPLMPETLFAEMAAVLHAGHSRPSSERRQAASAVPAADKNLVLDMESLLRRVENDEELLRALLEDFLERKGAKLLELEETLQRGDTEHAARLSHALKGSCGTLGLMQAHRAAATLERAMRDGAQDKGGALLQKLVVSLTEAEEAVRQVLQNRA